ncbi:MAG: fatty acid desaturase [Alphaproteobacteria bacterium]|nr:fatty acid desaturase [Alphaproteobacteria bacterium]
MEPTVARETEAAKRNMPEIAWPTILLAAGLLTGFALSCWLALSGVWPMWLAAMLNTVIIYALYTPVHDASHSAIVPRIKGLRWVNTAVGMACAAPLWIFFHEHRKSHFQHHARTNMEGDPDLWAKGSFARVTLIQVPLLLVNYFNPVALWRACIGLRLSAGERLETMALFALYTATAAAIVAAGYGMELAILWLAPWFVGLHVMQMLFGWAPHHDHSETGRYRDTRIAEFPLADFLTLQQNLHLIHHMLPSVPWYRYRAVFEEIRPILIENNVRIEGFWPSAPGRAGGTPGE